MVSRFSLGLPLLLALLIAMPLHADLKSDLAWQIDYVQKQILSLEEAVPQEKYTWRPADGVRSVSEAYLHIAFGNYILAKVAGVEPPADAGWSMDIEKWDKATTDKKAIANKINESFEHLKKALEKMSEAEMEKEVDFFGNKLTVRNVLITSVAHLHEHLGQSIAYARMNGVVPPWTAAEQKAQEEKK